MRVLMLNAGAKDWGATQEILHCVQEALPRGSQGELVCLGKQKIGYCQGCKNCYVTADCVIHDDMLPLLEKMDAADVLVIAAPSYWADVPGQFKVFIDRCTAYSETNPHPERRMLRSGKRCFVIALRTGNRPGECEHIIETVRHWCGHMHIELAGSMMFCGIRDEKDIVPHRKAITRQALAWFGAAQDGETSYH